MVEDSRLFGSMLKKQIESSSDLTVEWLQTYTAAEEMIQRGEADFFAALLDLNLPDAPDGEVVDLVLTLNIPVIVFTGDMSDGAREYIWSKKVAEYVLKESRESIDYILYLLDRLERNVNVKILIVDDSRFYRKIIRDLLQTHQYQTIEATNGSEALELLAQNKDITLVITDYNMPGMNGFELVKNIRTTHNRDKLSIIGLSTEGNANMSAQFIKSGANDFLNKPFGNEEFYCRITQAVVMMENIQRIMDLSNKDPLTDLYNRRFFYQAAYKMFSSAQRNQRDVSTGMLDIDFFKKVNDNYGHDIGDKVIQHLAHTLENHFSGNAVVARFGGEEFCVFTLDKDRDQITAMYEEFRKKIEASQLNFGEKSLQYTVSIGVCCHAGDSVEDMIKQSDNLLYVAKESGRNRVVVDQEL